MKYYLLTGYIEKDTEKAIGVAIGWNKSITNPRIYIEWIARSITKQEDKNIYIPAWLVAQNNNLKDQVDYETFIEVAEEKKTRKPRKTKAEKELEYYNNKLRLRFNDDIPQEYIEFYYDGNDLRFSEMNRLENIKNKDDVTKIIIVSNGRKEIVRG